MGAREFNAGWSWNDACEERKGLDLAFCSRVCAISVYICVSQDIRIPVSRCMFYESRVQEGFEGAFAVCEYIHSENNVHHLRAGKPPWENDFKVGGSEMPTK